MYGPSLIALLSDLGSDSAGMAQLRALLLKIFPAVPVVDIYHTRTDDYMPGAAYNLVAAQAHFPPDTLYLFPYRLFYQDRNSFVVTFAGDALYIGSDNGLLSMANGSRFGRSFGSDAGYTCKSFRAWQELTSDLLQQYAALGIEQLQMRLVGEGWQEFTRLSVRDISSLNVRGPEVLCSVLCVDRFGNVVLNITKPKFEELAAGRAFRIHTGARTFQSAFNDAYSDVPVGSPLCRFNDSGYLEIALNGQSAAVKLNMNAMDSRDMYYKRVAIFFDDPI